MIIDIEEYVLCTGRPLILLLRNAIIWSISRTYSSFGNVNRYII